MEAQLPRSGDTVDRYAVVMEIARGGMAVVYAIRRASLGGFDKLLALKLLLPHLAGERRFVDMFLDEARIAARIAHPNVVQTLDVGEHAGLPFIVMELLRGQTLSRVLKQGPVPLGFSLANLAQAAEGLHAAHRAVGEDGAPLQIVHRDVSGQNIHVGYDGAVKVLDFGIAAARGRLAATRTGELKGKLSYLAPEQVTRLRPVDHRADVWALGVVAWEALVGRRLFVAADEGTTLWNVVNLQVPALRSVAPEVPAPVAACIMACLERDPARRLADCGRFVETVGAAAARLGFATPAARERVMAALFVAERAVEEERLAAALRAAPASLVDREPGTPAAPTVAGHRRPARRWRLPAALAAVVLTGAIVAAVALSGARSFRPGALAAVPPAPGATPPAPAAPPPAAAATRPAAAATRPAGLVPAPRTVVVIIDPRARLALVDGVRQDARPLRLALPEGGAATVEVVGPHGETVRRTVVGAAASAAVTIMLPDAPAGPARHPVRRPAAGRGPGPARPAPSAAPEPLLGNPY
jgi:serine/threonine-protein kinase